MLDYEEYMTNLYSCIVKYEQLTDSHMVDFLTENLWEKIVPLEIRLFYERCGSEKNSVEVNPFFEEIDELLVPFKSVCNLEDDKYETSEVTKLEFHAFKKLHEIQRFSKFIDKVLSKPTVVIDAGAGKGYLSMFLAKNHNVPVLGIESSSTTHKGALKQYDLVAKKTIQPLHMVKYTVENIDEKTDYSSLAEIHFPNVEGKKNLTLVGLHTCGSLAHWMAKSFAKNDDLKTLCFVPCCYHLANESLNKVYKFTKNQRMLAQQRQLDPKPDPSLFYRAVLQTVIHSLDIQDRKIGRGISANDFQTYVTLALKKIKVPESMIPSPASLEKTYQEHLQHKWKFEAFHSLRCYMAPVLEAAILIDIILYVQKNVNYSQLELKQVFENSISPRSCAIVAIK